MGLLRSRSSLSSVKLAISPANLRSGTRGTNQTGETGERYNKLV